MTPTPTNVDTNGRRGSNSPVSLEDVVDPGILSHSAVGPLTFIPVWQYKERDPLATILACADFAAKKHRDQRRKDKDGTPYINHPLGVANILTAEAKVYDSTLAQVAILHDTIEDTETTFEELVENFGIEVASMVIELSDEKDKERHVRKRVRIENAPKKSTGAKIVGMCDKIYNLRDLLRQTPNGWDEKRVNEYFIWAEEVCKHYYSANENLAAILKDIFKAQKESVKSPKEVSAGEELRSKAISPLDLPVVEKVRC